MPIVYYDPKAVDAPTIVPTIGSATPEIAVDEAGADEEAQLVEEPEASDRLVAKDLP